MKFLGKSSGSKVLSGGIKYKQNRARNNNKLKTGLIKEQKNFCAYTEKYIQELDSCELEHFDSSKKYKDDDGYYNYYAVIRGANLYKKDKKYVGSSFFNSLFFQDIKKFNKRIKYIKGGLYEESDLRDKEAADLIDFLGFNHPYLYKQRQRHIKRLIRNFEDASYDGEKAIEYLRSHQEDLSFITAIEIELVLDLSEFYK